MSTPRLHATTTGALRGQGSPLGVVSAPPGTVYIDTVGTLGAWEWIKTTGTGTAGWVVKHGRLALEVPESAYLNGWVRRLSTVPMRIYITPSAITFDAASGALNGGAATDGHFMDYPAALPVPFVGNFGALGIFMVGSGSGSTVLLQRNFSSGGRRLITQTGLDLSGSPIIPYSGTPWPTSIPPGYTQQA